MKGCVLFFLFLKKKQGFFFHLLIFGGWAIYVFQMKIIEIKKMQ